MYFPIKPQPNCATAWLAAVKGVDGCDGHEAHNVIIGVADPINHSESDEKVISEVDKFLRKHDHWSVETVANTIFPQSTLERHGSPAFYDIYLEKIFPKIKRAHGDWGRYFERMISFPLKKKGETVNPLKAIVEKMKRQVGSERCFKNVYELTIFDPIRDAGPVMNRQCLSFLSFKLTDDAPRKLLLTAVYRNHYYMERLLGNLIGLGRLMKFVAEEVGVVVGDLTIVSTHAEIDTAATRSKITDLFEACETYYSSSVNVKKIKETEAAN
jgi:thymidylate synthase